jgi:hypothetical protein
MFRQNWAKQEVNVAFWDFQTYCGVFTPCKNCNLETCSRDYATVDDAVFSPSRAELCCAVTSRSSPSLLTGNSYKLLDDARVGRGHVTASAVTSRVSTVTQQLKYCWKERFPRVRSRVYRRHWSSFTSSSRWEIAVALGEFSAWVVKNASVKRRLMCDNWNVRLW